MRVAVEASSRTLNDFKRRSKSIPCLAHHRVVADRPSVRFRRSRLGELCHRMHALKDESSTTERLPIAQGATSIALSGVLLYLLGSLAALAAEPDTSLTASYHPVAADVQNLAQNEEFWSNLARYGRYFVTVLLGTAYTAVKPLGNLLKNPLTAAITVGVLAGLYFFVNATLKGMLGVNQEPLTLLDY